jgi:hypothetical protein
MRKSLKEYITALGHWGWVVAVILVGDIYGIISSYLSSSNANFVLPIWAWWVILVVILILSPFIAFHKLRLAKDESQNKLEGILNAKPRLVLKEIESPAKDIAKGTLVNGVFIPKFYPSFTRIWVANEPSQVELGIDAINVHGQVLFYDQSQTKILLNMSGRWAGTKQPAETITETQQITIPPNLMPYCLDICMKYLEDDDFYGYDDIAHKLLDGKNPKTKLGKGTYFVKVILACKGVNLPLYFQLDNLGKNHDVTFVETKSW